jgi:ABC-2 type transport system ATP-binding protein
MVVVRGSPAPQLVEKLSGVANARRAAIVREENGKVWARVYPKTSGQNGEFARSVMRAASAWEVEELHTEEGRLDEVFRNITLPDTEKEIEK